MQTRNQDRMRMLVTGASGMIGRYVCKEFCDMQIDTLGLNEQNDIVVDITDRITLTAKYDVVVHCAGTTSEQSASKVNYQGTVNLLQALEQNPPRYFVQISSLSVYGLTEGNDVTEDYPLRPITKYGKSKLAAESELKKWCADKGVVLTILRPTLTFGNGVSGKAAEMFDAIIKGRYFHIRGNQARRSIVMADDVAKACRLTFKDGGIYNVSDGYNHSVIELGDAMAANCGENKRIVHCSLKLLKIGAKLGDILPGFGKLLDSDKLTTLTSSLTFSNARLIEKTGLKFYDTVEVIARRSKDYPYEFND